MVPVVKARATDLVLLDLMRPGGNGLDVCRDLRCFSEIPIVMLTARVEEADRLLGLELGADDYICKTPFSPREVVARVKAVLRRARSSGHDLPPGLVIDESSHCAFFKGVPLNLTPVEFRLLKTLSSMQGRVFSRASLLEKLHADGREVTDRVVDTHIKNLRRKLVAATSGKELIHSVYGIGYRFELPPD